MSADRDSTVAVDVLKGDAVAALCRRLGVERLEVFGSAGTGAFQAGRSDVDLIVHLRPAAGGASMGARLIEFADAMESLLGAPVDLMTDHPIANPYLRAAVAASRRTVYDESAAQAPL